MDVICWMWLGGGCGRRLRGEGERALRRPFFIALDEVSFRPKAAVGCLRNLGLFNVSGALAAIDRNEEFIKMTLAKMLTPE